ncbi:MAG TPA: hypothetical protein VFR11_00630 [Micromonosporaceae bacterium]|nr:hypothetical protein [Micromonosporaceae bacterium]
MVGRQSSTDTEPTATIVDDRGERAMGPADAQRQTDGAMRAEPATHRPSRGRVFAGRRGNTTVIDRDSESDMTTGRRIMTGDRTDSFFGDSDDGDTAAAQVATTTGWTRVGAAATLSLIAGTLAITATLTGLLAPIGLLAGVIAVLLGVLAFYEVRRPGVTGHSLVGLGVLFGLVAIVLSILAMTGAVSWLSNKTDEIAVLHNWLNDHFHWLRRW